MLLPKKSGFGERNDTLSRHPSKQGALRPVAGHVRPPAHAASTVSLPCALSKLGYCSRTEALTLIEARRVLVNGKPARSASQRVDMVCDVAPIFYPA